MSFTIFIAHLIFYEIFIQTLINVVKPSYFIYLSLTLKARPDLDLDPYFQKSQLYNLPLSPTYNLDNNWLMYYTQVHIYRKSLYILNPPMCDHLIKDLYVPNSKLHLRNWNLPDYLLNFEIINRSGFPKMVMRFWLWRSLPHFHYQFLIFEHEFFLD